MEYWGSIADIGLILFFCSLPPYRNRSHSTKPSIPLLQYSNTPMAFTYGIANLR